MSFSRDIASAQSFADCRCFADPLYRGEFLLLVAVAVAVASPFLFAIIWKYGSHVQNRLPTFWIHPALLLDHLGTFTRTQLIRLVMVPVAIGLLTTLSSEAAHNRRILLAWIGWCIVLLAYAYLWQAFFARGVALPSVVPGFHFARLLEGGECVLFGVGMASGVQFVMKVLPRARMQLESRPNDCRSRRTIRA
jgi:hypothetical protein